MWHVSYLIPLLQEVYNPGGKVSLWPLPEHVTVKILEIQMNETLFMEA